MSPGRSCGFREGRGAHAYAQPQIRYVHNGRSQKDRSPQASFRYRDRNPFLSWPVGFSLCSLTCSRSLSLCPLAPAHSSSHSQAGLAQSSH